MVHDSDETGDQAMSDAGCDEHDDTDAEARRALVRAAEDRLNTLVYVAGPYSGDVEANVARAREVGRKLIEAGYSVIVPHLLGYPGTQDDRWWYASTLAMMLRCDCVFVVPGWVCSVGARNEVVTMWERNQSVYDTIEPDGVVLSPTGREVIDTVFRGVRARRMFPVYGQTVVTGAL